VSGVLIPHLTKAARSPSMGADAWKGTGNPEFRMNFTQVQRAPDQSDDGS
jgi:hypothetical protein